MFRSNVIPLRRLRTSVFKCETLRVVSSACSASVNEVQPKPFESIPGPRGIYPWPIIGSVLNFKPFTNFTPDKLRDYLNHMHDIYGPIFKLELGAPSVVTSEPKDFETVYRNEGKYPVRPRVDLAYIYCQRNNKTHNFPQLQGQEWHAMRTLVNKRLLKADSALHYLQHQNEVADDFVKILETKKLSPEDLQDLFFRFASESIAVVTFNKRLGLFDKNPDKESVEFLDASKKSLHMIQKALYGDSVAHKWYRNKTYKIFESSMAIIERVTEKHIATARKVVEDKIRARTFNEDEPNLLYSLISDKTLTDQDVGSIMRTLYNAGTDSTAKNTQVFFYTLAKNPEKQKILRREILDNIGRDGTLTADALSKMIYLKAALKESFRLCSPAAIGNKRILPVDVVLSGYKVPAGVHVILSNPRAAKTHFENPDQFLPERWLRTEDNTKKESSHNMIVLPFGHGPRNCIGRRFAVQEIYLATVKVLQRLHIETESNDIKFKHTPFIEPDKPIKFIFLPIN